MIIRRSLNKKDKVDEVEPFEFDSITYDETAPSNNTFKDNAIKGIQTRESQAFDGFPYNEAVEKQTESKTDVSEFEPAQDGISV